jgi:hypothetical protein
MLTIHNMFNQHGANINLAMGSSCSICEQTDPGPIYLRAELCGGPSVLRSRDQWRAFLHARVQVTAMPAELLGLVVEYAAPITIGRSVTGEEWYGWPLLHPLDVPETKWPSWGRVWKSFFQDTYERTTWYRTNLVETICTPDRSWLEKQFPKENVRLSTLDLCTFASEDPIAFHEPKCSEPSCYAGLVVSASQRKKDMLVAWFTNTVPSVEFAGNPPAPLFLSAQ